MRGREQAIGRWARGNAEGIASALTIGLVALAMWPWPDGGRAGEGGNPNLVVLTEVRRCLLDAEQGAANAPPMLSRGT